ncbi:MAG: S8 family serine peptidase [Ferruginibacter sp.]|nr:S8 family serine peptidase [Ferruginibacter sp.]
MKFSIAQDAAVNSGIQNKEKLSPPLKNIVATNVTEKYIVVAKDINQLIIQLNTLDKSIAILQKNELANAIVIKASSKVITEIILPITNVLFIDKYVEPKTEIGIIGYNRSLHGINALDYLLPNANGKNITIGIKENNLESNDLDIYKRIVPSTLASTRVENHATVIASIVGGAGNSFYDGRGLANAGNFFSSSFANLFVDDATILTSKNVSVQNHSYGTIPQQFYGAEAVSYDAATWNNKNIIHIFSVGNRGTSFATDGKYANITGFANSTGNFKMAKNSITVGAINTNGSIAAESSAGPAYDGRIMPQITALGPNGTSDAAAIVSGTIAVMQQVYKDSNAQALPSAALIKAILYTTTEDIYNKGVDYKTGYGLLNAYNAVKHLQQKKYDGSNIQQNQTWTKTIAVPANAAQLKVTLAWTDSTAGINNNKALLNNLDIEVKDINTNAIYLPWVLSTAANADSLNKVAVRKKDTLNTAEQITIDLPSAGNYEIKVIGTNIANTNVPFSVAYSIDTLNTFQFISPQHASDININENPLLDVKWKTFVADTNQIGKLYISYNRGLSWDLISQQKIYTNKYSWPIKDTSTTALFKMETLFGDFISNEVIISRVIQPKLDFVCTDSFRLSWNKHVYANGYQIYSLIDSAFLKPVKLVTDTFNVFITATSPSVVYAVQPILNNNLPAARSVAIDINFQGTKCFYKTIYFELQNENIVKLIAEVSGNSYLDSIYFEKVTPQGILIKQYAGQKINLNTALYNALVNDLNNGTTYFRAKIKLKNGAIVYTEIVEVLTSGKRKILFYPNPVVKKGTLNLVLEQGVPVNSGLQIFDAMGRLVFSKVLQSNSVSINSLPAGVLHYKLLDINRNTIETGKILVQ